MTADPIGYMTADEAAEFWRKVWNRAADKLEAETAEPADNVVPLVRPPAVR